MTARATPDQTPVVGDEKKQARSREAGEVNTNTSPTPPHPVEEAVALTPERIAELRKIAEGASPGPWFVSQPWMGFSQITAADGGLVFGLAAGEAGERRGEAECEDNAAYLRTFNPVLVRELLSALERQREALERGSGPDGPSGLASTQLSRQSEPSSAALAVIEPDDEAREFLAAVVGVVEANSFEQMALWQRNNGRRSWEDNPYGIGRTVGYVGDMPVFVSLITATVDGHKVLFFHPTSQVVDHRMVEAWLRRALPKCAFRSDSYLNKTDAMNFWNVVPTTPATHTPAPVSVTGSLQAAEAQPSSLNPILPKGGVMTERPILFSAPMVRAILEGRKTQTRRAVKGRPENKTRVGPVSHQAHVASPEALDHCPYGKPGDTLWVREAFSGPYWLSGNPPSEWPELSQLRDGIDAPIWYWADGNFAAFDATRPKPSIHMPRWACRITLRITDVRVERLQDISEADAAAEGAARLWTDGEGAFYEGDRGTHRVGFAGLWSHINGPGSWDANPWVWVVQFERLGTTPEDVTQHNADGGEVARGFSPEDTTEPQSIREENASG